MKTAASLNCRWVLLITLAACDGTQTVSLTAEDFRFVPNFAKATSSSPLTLSVYNAGREVHEFDSSILMYAAIAPLPKGENGSVSGVLLKPGQSLQIALAPPPGTYLYICRRKGHANMTGTLVVE